MRKIINKTARYIIFIWCIIFILLLLCVCNDKNAAAAGLVNGVFIAFFVVTIILFVTYIIHLFWMIIEKRKPQNIKLDIISIIVLVLLICAYDIYAGRFGLEDIWKKIVFVILVIVSSEISKYIYSWKE